MARRHYARTCRDLRGRSPNSQNNEDNQTQDFQPFKDHALAAEVISSESKLSSKRIPSTSCGRDCQLLQANVSEIWLTDSGASAHVYFQREWFSEFHPRRDGISIALGDSSQCAVAGIGTIPIAKWVNTECTLCNYEGFVNGELVLLAIFVNDGFMACRSVEVLYFILSELNKEFKINVADATYFVVLQIKRDKINNTMIIHQSAYIEQVICKYGMSEANSLSTPADPSVILHGRNRQ